MNSIETQPLSETLQLDHLWNTLSDCLVELEENADHHAVLVLQPAVEAFFLVHASSATNTSNTKTLNSTHSEQENRLQNPSRTQNGNTTENSTDSNNVANANDNFENNETVQPTENNEVPVDESREISPVSPISLFDIPNNNSETQQQQQQQQETSQSQSQSTDPVGNIFPRGSFCNKKS